MKLLSWFLIPIAIFGLTDKYVFRAVDPILPINQLQFENDYSPINAHANGASNIFYLKPLFRILPNRLVPVNQGIRFEFQLVTTPNGTTNLGDTQFFDLFLAAGDGWEVGLGPMAIFPSALSSATGQGKWQLGPAFGFLMQIAKTQFGLLAQNPISFAGPSSRPDQNYLLFQPLLFQHFGKGWYLKANPQWTLDWLHHSNKIPLNLGIGRVFAIGKQHFNASLSFEGMAYQNDPSYVPTFTLQFFLSYLLEQER